MIQIRKGLSCQCHVVISNIALFLGQEDKTISWHTTSSAQLKASKSSMNLSSCQLHDDNIKRKHFARYWPFVKRIHRPPPPQKRPVTRNLVFSLIFAWTNGWANNREAGDLRPRRAHYGVTANSSDIRHMCGVSLHLESCLKEFSC